LAQPAVKAGDVLLFSEAGLYNNVRWAVPSASNFSKRDPQRELTDPMTSSSTRRCVLYGYMLREEAMNS
jgi:hypothetical protein